MTLLPAEASCSTNIDRSKSIVVHRRPMSQLELGGHISHTSGSDQAGDDFVVIPARKALFISRFTSNITTDMVLSYIRKKMVSDASMKESFSLSARACFLLCNNELQVLYSLYVPGYCLMGVEREIIALSKICLSEIVYFPFDRVRGKESKIVCKD
uniref:Uncharacterized protein n=1 Tax=Glossina pallidipes TaxID=7398 RepID=A0A1A9ZJL8_GLOPL